MKRVSDFLFPKKRKVHIDKLLVDLHSHLIPSIDDGSKNMDESILLIKALSNLGYTKLITTPHIMFDAYSNTKKSILKALLALQTEIKKHSIDITIHTAAEYYLDEGFLPLIKKRDLLLINKKYVLFETSYTHKPQQLEEIIFEIQKIGYIPLLAHPERYRYIIHPLDEYLHLKKLGVQFQVNINSLSGHYGKQAQKNALILSKQGLIDFLGSDIHNIRQVQNLSKVLQSSEYSDVYKFNKIQNNSLL